MISAVMTAQTFEVYWKGDYVGSIQMDVIDDKEEWYFTVVDGENTYYLDLNSLTLEYDFEISQNFFAPSKEMILASVKSFCIRAEMEEYTQRC